MATSFTITTRVVFFFVHAALHVLLYIIPQSVYVCFVQVPLQCLHLLSSLFFAQNLVGEGIAKPCSTRIEYDRSRPETLKRFGLTVDDDQCCVEGPQYTAPLYNGHVSTILGSFRPFPAVQVKRETVPSYDGNPICLDFMYPDRGVGGGSAPPIALALVLPGLTGTSSEVYVRRVAAALLDHNIAVCVLNARGVGDTPLTTPQIFSALFTADLRFALQRHLRPAQVSARLGAAAEVPVVGVAFSLGGLIMTNYLGEEGKAQRPSGLAAAFTVTSPHSLAAGDRAMDRPVARSLYGAALSADLRRYYERHMEVMHKLPGVDSDKVFSGPKPLVDRIHTVRGFDDVITAPHFGYESASAYYAAADNFLRFPDIMTPQMCLVAANDPICGAPQSREKWAEAVSQHKGGLVYVEFPGGGHLGFVGSPLQEVRGEQNPMEKLLVNAVMTVVRGT